jgi:sugar O-acyltransferase (sialic acid O-acetyltransferase NeuD family)
MRLVIIGGFCEMEEMLRRAGHEIFRVVGASEDEAYIASGDKLIPIVVSPDGTLRRKVVEKYAAAGFKFAAIVAKTADVSESAAIGDGTVVAEHAVVTAETKVGKFVKINTAATVTHECLIADYATIAPRAVLLGRVKVGEGAYIGANATVLPGLTIGKGAVVGAGAVVTRDVPDGETWVGVPARRIG